MSKEGFWEIGYTALRELETEQGILASGKEEIFGCIFGRDSLITTLEMLRAYERTGDPYLLTLAHKVLINLIALQGKEVNIESGEEPGKCIHEFRPSNHEHLTGNAEHPWFLYPDNVMRNYDTVDATPLLLIALHRYYELSHDAAFVARVLPAARAAIGWLLAYGDTNGDGFIDYRFHPDRTYGGLHTQSWMDSSESLFSDTAGSAAYPIAPVEVQAYTYLALRLWSDFFTNDAAAAGNGGDPAGRRRLAAELTRRARELKRKFNERFIIEDGKGGFAGLAFAIDGNGRQLSAARSSMGHCLWAIRRRKNGARDGILDNIYVPKLIERLMAPDLFEPDAGIRTLSSSSPNFDASSYHNGSIWPHDTALFIEGLENFGYRQKANKVRRALFMAFDHFRTPIELFVFANGSYAEYRSSGGQLACRKQAWSAGAILMESVARK